MKHFLGGIVFLLGVYLPSLAFGSVDFTNTGPDDSFNDGANWTTDIGPGVVPGPNDEVHIFPGFTTVADPAASNITVSPGGATTITINSSTNQHIQSLLVSSNFLTNSVPNGVLNLNFTGGSTLTVGLGPTIITGGATVNYLGNYQMPLGSVIVGTSTSTLDPGQVTGPGTLNLTSGTFNLDSAGATSFIVGQSTAAAGTVTQGTGSTVNTGQSLLIGSAGGTGTYSLTAGSTLNIGTLGAPASTAYDVQVGSGANSTGSLIITGSTLNASNAGTTIELGDGAGASGTITQNGSSVTLGATSVEIGDGGTGLYQLQSGTLMIGSPSGTATATTFSVGGVAGSTGGFAQTGGALTVGPNSTFSVGTGGATSGTYSLSGGSTATFNDGLTVGATGAVVQTGGTLTIATGKTLDLTTAGGSYNLNGGTLQVGTNGLAGNASDGALNFGGGTLQATGNLTDALDGTLSGNSTIDAGTGGTVILSGTLIGSGALTIGNGTVQASTANLPGIGGVTIDTGGTFNLTTSGNATDTFTGAISGGGNLETGNAGVSDTGTAIPAPAGYKLILANTIDLPSSMTTIAANTGLEAANGTLDTINGGAGSTFEVGGGSGGTITVLGTATVPTVTVDSGSGLQIGNVVGNVVNNGTLSTLAPETNLMITGSLHQPMESTVAQEGTLLVRANGTTSDTYSANSATLYGTIEVQAVGSHTYTIVSTSAPGLLTTGTLNSATPGGLATAPDLPLLTTVLSSPGAPGAHQFLLLTTTQSNLSPFATTPNQAAVAGAIDQVIQNPPASAVPLLLGIDSLSAAQIPGALDELTPRSYLYMRDIAFENSTFLAQKVDGFLGNLRNGFTGLDTSGLSILGPGLDSSLGRSLGSLLAYNNEGVAPNGVNYYPVDDESSSDILAQPGPSNPSGPATISDSPDSRMAPTVAPPPSTSVFNGLGTGVNEFISGDVILADLNQNSAGNSEPKAHYTAGNATAGISFRMSSNLAAGVLFDYNHTDAKTDSVGSHVRVDSYSPGLFATFFEKGFYANGLFTFGFNHYSDNRNIDFAGLTANSSPDGQQYVGNLDFGYDFHPDPHWSIGPTLGIEYTHLDVDSFHETGAGDADLTVNSQSADSLRGRIGGRVAYQARSGSILFQPNFTAAFQREFLDDSFDLTSQLDLPGTPAFTTQGSNPGRNSALIGVGLTATLDNSMSMYLNYLAEIGGEDYFVQSVEGGFKASF
jgi:fibronectin-binding autotransporter adhesin